MNGGWSSKRSYAELEDDLHCETEIVRGLREIKKEQIKSLMDSSNVYRDKASEAMSNDNTEMYFLFTGYADAYYIAAELLRK